MGSIRDEWIQERREKRRKSDYTGPVTSSGNRSKIEELEERVGKLEERLEELEEKMEEDGSDR